MGIFFGKFTRGKEGRRWINMVMSERARERVSSVVKGGNMEAAEGFGKTPGIWTDVRARDRIYGASIKMGNIYLQSSDIA